MRPPDDRRLDRLLAPPARAVLLPDARVLEGLWPTDAAPTRLRAARGFVERGGATARGVPAVARLLPEPRPLRLGPRSRHERCGFRRSAGAAAFLGLPRRPHRHTCSGRRVARILWQRGHRAALARPCRGRRAHHWPSRFLHRAPPRLAMARRARLARCALRLNRSRRAVPRHLWHNNNRAAFARLTRPKEEATVATLRAACRLPRTARHAGTHRRRAAGARGRGCLDPRHSGS